MQKRNTLLFQWYILYIYNILIIPKISAIQFVTVKQNLQEIQNPTTQRITESVRLEGTIVGLVQPGSSQSTRPRIVSGHSCAMKGWVWSTSDSWKSVCLESEFREDSRLLYVMSTSKVPKVQLCSLWIMVNIHQNIFLIIIYCNTNWSFIYPTKKCLRWVCFALLEKTRNYSTGKNLIHSKQNSAVLFIITYRMLTNITKSLQGKNSKVPSENFNLECLQTVCSHSILI